MFVTQAGRHAGTQRHRKRLTFIRVWLTFIRVYVGYISFFFSLSFSLFLSLSFFLVKKFSHTAEPQTTINSPSSHAPSHVANALCPEPHLATRISFFHATLFSPAISTFCSAIDAGLLNSLPGNITSSQVRKHLFLSEAMHKGPLDQESQGIWSTKLQEPRPTLKQTMNNHKLLLLSKADNELLQA